MWIFVTWLMMWWTVAAANRCMAKNKRPENTVATIKEINHVGTEEKAP